MHPLHQILARAAGREKVKPGEFIVAKVDLAEIKFGTHEDNFCNA